MVTSHPYMEDYVVLPTRSAIRSDDRSTDHDISKKVAHEDSTVSRWRTAVESRPTINLFEQWKEGSQLGKHVTGRRYFFPACLVVPCPG